MKAICAILLCFLTATASAQECSTWSTLLDMMRQQPLDSVRLGGMDSTGSILVTFTGPHGRTVVRVTPTNCATIVRQDYGLWSERRRDKR